MTSRHRPDEAFVWVWLPSATEPVVAGRIERDGDLLRFNYGRGYLAREDAIPLYEPELPLRPGALAPLPGLTIAGCLRDAAPDAWGRRVILNRRFGRKRDRIDVDQLDELTYLLESSSDRIGALDFQTSATRYTPRGIGAATLNELMAAADCVESGTPIPPELDLALFHGSSIGGARPKAILDDGSRKLIAKFSSRDDVLNVVKGEFVAMRLAARAGLDVARVELVSPTGKDVLLIERFDRERTTGGWRRNAMVSALTLFELDEMMARYASYERFAELVRHRFEASDATLRELFGRLVFNVLCGNTDDHARNHAAFWNGRSLALTPAYDICPQPRAGGKAGQAMRITGNDNTSTLATCLAAAPNFHVSVKDATAIMERQVCAIREHWPAVCEEAALTQVERNLLWRRQFLNPFAFEDAPAGLARFETRD